MAQQTKAGHVYVISNIGSFGESVFKVGMTRRLDPMDRVKELGDASVPFEFDVHAIVYSENAPELEKLLHRDFEHKRLNLVNNRKEFFEIALDEIEQIVKKHKGDVQFTKAAEAREYRESMKIKSNLQNTDITASPSVLEALPQSI
ncbi:PF13250 domain protein [Leptospira santarosai]|uniref:PF13250 domain protein n=2 Tax=Leptospira santarosai TaxID=28183 RepID=A0A2P1QPC8_9LEPT|nr:PF13250 domain protein [Leptospira santarosai]